MLGQFQGSADVYVPTVESDSTVTVVAESSIHFTVQYNNYSVLHIIEYKYFKIIFLTLFRLYHKVQLVLPHVQVEVKP